MNSLEDEHFTTDELALKLKVNTETVRRLIRSGKLAAIKLGNTYRVPAAEYERFTTPAPRPTKPRTQRDAIRELMRSA
jgi:excisionase family DNA binding protein